MKNLINPTDACKVDMAAYGVPQEPEYDEWGEWGDCIYDGSKEEDIDESARAGEFDPLLASIGFYHDQEAQEADDGTEDDAKTCQGDPDNIYPYDTIDDVSDLSPEVQYTDEDVAMMREHDDVLSSHQKQKARWNGKKRVRQNRGVLKYNTQRRAAQAIDKAIELRKRDKAEDKKSIAALLDALEPMVAFA